MAVELEDLKNFMRVDPDIVEDDALIESLGAAATGYLEQTTGKKFNDKSEIMVLTVKQLVLLWYEDRTSYSTKTSVNDLPHHLSALIHHIALAAAYEPLEQEKAGDSA